MLSLMGMRNELLQTLWEVIAEMQRARLQGDDDQAQRLERISAPQEQQGWGYLHVEKDLQR